ncbi:MAG TPA: glycosyltransferase family 2 protein [Candidatus Hydrogenedentes bacterium]|nr:glycosyltransferase family 2 protein [Candidatus Hydrogenedentota bacterium]
MGVDVIVVSYNTRELLRACLRSVESARTDVDALNLYVVDNASADGSPAMVRQEFPSAHLIALDTNIGFGPANNRGMRAGQSEYLLFLNSDAELRPGALRALKECLSTDPACVAVGPRLEYPDGRFQLSCRRFPTLLRSIWNTTGLQGRYPRRFSALRSWLDEADHIDGATVDMVSGACFLMRRDYLESIGGFDDDLFLYEEEMDIMLPARRRGNTVRYCASARVAHHHGASSGEQEASDMSLFHLYRSKYYTFRKHYGALIAWLTYATDYAVFKASILRNKLRGTPTPATRSAEYCVKGFRAAHK